MKVQELTIRRQASYETDAGQMRGLVTLVGDEGSQSLALSPRSISRIFEVIREDAMEKAKLQSKQVSSAIAAAADEPLLLTNSEIPNA